MQVKGDPSSESFSQSVAERHLSRTSGDRFSRRVDWRANTLTDFCYSLLGSPFTSKSSTPPNELFVRARDRGQDGLALGWCVPSGIRPHSCAEHVDQAQEIFGVFSA